LYFGLVTGTPGLYPDLAAEALGVKPPQLLALVDKGLYSAKLGSRTFQHEFVAALKVVAGVEGRGLWEPFVDWTRAALGQDPKSRMIERPPDTSGKKLLRVARSMRKNNKEVTQLSLALEIGLPEGVLHQRLELEPNLRIRLLDPAQWRRQQKHQSSKRGGARTSSRQPTYTSHHGVTLPSRVGAVHRVASVSLGEARARLREIFDDRHDEETGLDMGKLAKRRY
jgi:hypothetical protein